MRREDDPAWLRTEGQRLVEQGRAMLARADNVEADRALGEEPPNRSGAKVGTTKAVRELLGTGAWVTARAAVEHTKTGNERSAASLLSRMCAAGELEKRKVGGFPTEYRIRMEVDRG